MAHEDVAFPALNHPELADMEIVDVVALLEVKLAQWLPFIRNYFLALFLEPLGPKELFCSYEVDGLLVRYSG